MRTTIRIDDNLLKEAKKAAIESNISFTALVELALKEVLYRRNTEKKSPLELVTFKGNGIRHGVDLDDSSALLDIMDGF